MTQLEIIIDVIQNVKALYLAIGFSGMLICLIIILIILDMKFNKASGSKYLINGILKLFKQNIRFRIMDLRDHTIFQRIDRFLIKLKIYSTTSDYYRNVAKSTILTIKWLIIKEEFILLVSKAELKEGDFKSKVMRTFERILERYEINLREHLPKTLAEAYLCRANIRHPEMFLVIENFLDDIGLDDMRNLSNILSYVSSYMLLDSVDTDKIFEEMNGALSEHAIFLENVDIDSIKLIG